MSDTKYDAILGKLRETDASTPSAADIPVSNMEGANVQEELQIQKTQIDQKAAATHTHAIADVTGLALALEPLNGLANVATSGSYNDLTDTPVVPADVSDLTDASKKILTKPGVWTGKTNNTTFTATEGGWLRIKFEMSNRSTTTLSIDGVVVAGVESYNYTDVDSPVFYWFVPIFSGQTYMCTAASVSPQMYFAPCS